MGYTPGSRHRTRPFGDGQVAPNLVDAASRAAGAASPSPSVRGKLAVQAGRQPKPALARRTDAPTTARVAHGAAARSAPARANPGRTRDRALLEERRAGARPRLPDHAARSDTAAGHLPEHDLEGRGRARPGRIRGRGVRSRLLQLRHRARGQRHGPARHGGRGAARGGGRSSSRRRTATFRSSRTSFSRSSSSSHGPRASCSYSTSRWAGIPAHGIARRRRRGSTGFACSARGSCARCSPTRPFGRSGS